MHMQAPVMLAVSRRIEAERYKAWIWMIPAPVV